MENSINNSVRRTRFSYRQKTIYEEEGGPEESSWTMYFEDFFKKNHNNDHDHRGDHDDNGYNFDETDDEEGFGCYVDDSSMISDAASPAGATAANKMARRNGNRMISSSSKKRRRILHEQQEQEKEQEQEDTPPVANDLEDTASSPSNSPKGCSIMEEIRGNNQGETEDTTQRGGEDIDVSESNINRMNEYSTELKKKGLCLVPLSALSTYMI